MTFNASSSAPRNNTVAAFFDVDNTLVRGATLFHFARGLARYKFFSRRQLWQGAWKQAKFVALGREIHKDIRKVTEVALGFIEGREEREITALSTEVVDSIILKKLWQETVEIAKQHIASGHEVWLVTASPQYVASELAARLGLTGALGTRVEVVDGSFTGKLEGFPLHGKEKAIAIEALAKTRNLDLSRSIAYSDSTNDLPLLRAVAHAVTVNPERRLRRIARKNNWPIVDHRKSRSLRRSTEYMIPVL
jgi:HAD superfamily hydrolase (TIGR01490 family)